MYLIGSNPLAPDQMEYLNSNNLQEEEEQWAAVACLSHNSFIHNTLEKDDCKYILLSFIWSYFIKLHRSNILSLEYSIFWLWNQPFPFTFSLFCRLKCWWKVIIVPLWDPPLLCSAAGHLQWRWGMVRRLMRIREKGEFIILWEKHSLFSFSSCEFFVWKN